jgi:hypothetical protein
MGATATVEAERRSAAADARHHMKHDTRAGRLVPLARITVVGFVSMWRSFGRSGGIERMLQKVNKGW